jgi:hypothetical protein
MLGYDGHLAGKDLPHWYIFAGLRHEIAGLVVRLP